MTTDQALADQRLDQITMIAAQLVVLRNSLTITNGEYLNAAQKALLYCYELGKKDGKNGNK